jgi:hypothetical protein
MMAQRSVFGARAAPKARHHRRFLAKSHPIPHCMRDMDTVRLRVAWESAAAATCKRGLHGPAHSRRHSRPQLIVAHQSAYGDMTIRTGLMMRAAPAGDMPIACAFVARRLLRPQAHRKPTATRMRVAIAMLMAFSPKLHFDSLARPTHRPGACGRWGPLPLGRQGPGALWQQARCVQRWCCGPCLHDLR